MVNLVKLRTRTTLVHKTTRGEDVYCLHREGATSYRLVTECHGTQHEIFKSQDPSVTLDQMIRFVEAFADAFAILDEGMPKG